MERRPRWARLDRAALGEALRLEGAAQAERWMLWTPVAFGGGAAVYFGLKFEPPLWPAAAALAVTLLLAIAAQLWGRSRLACIAATLFALAAAGFLAGAVKTRLMAAPVVPPDLHVVRLEGTVIDVASPSADRARLLIAPSWIARIPPEALPARVRITVDPQSVYGPGTAVRALALLNPPPGPASPGAYDFARDAWFERLGGVGLALEPPQVISLPPPRLGDRLAIAVNRLRWALARRLGAELERITGEEGGAAGLAVTVATSHEGWLSPQAEDDLRASGLAHMLAIAGLHTAAVIGFVFIALRLGVAAWPWAALRLPGKKVAAAGALSILAVYLVLSGAHPPAKRAAITAATACVAMLLDRRAVSLHALAIAALVILVLQPEAITQPGFQMSFSATAALVALAEVTPRRPRPIAAPWPILAIEKARDVIGGLLMVSLVAGAATAPFALQHFNRVALYSVFANLTADFVASLVLMPALVAGVLLLALGAPQALTDPPLAVAGWGASAILRLGHLFGSAPGAVMLTPSAPEPALAVAFVGIVFACLWRGRLRWLGLPLSCAVLLWPRPVAPVAWIAADAGNAAVVLNGRAIPMKPQTRSFATGAWAQHRGLALDVSPEANARLFDCGRSACAPTATRPPPGAPRLAAWFSPRPPKTGELDRLCASADILVLRAEVDPPAPCARRLVLTADMIARHGATEVFAKPGGGWRLAGAQAQRGLRPWSTPSSDTGG